MCECVCEREMDGDKRDRERGREMRVWRIFLVKHCLVEVKKIRKNGGEKDTFARENNTKTQFPISRKKLKRTVLSKR